MLDDMRERNCDAYWVYFDQKKRKRSYIQSYRRMKKLFKSIQPDVVHTHLFDDGLPGMLAARHTGVPQRVHTKQSTGFHWYYTPKKVRYDRIINRMATDLIAVTGECKEFLIEKERAPKEKIQLIHHGIDFGTLTKADESSINEFRQKFNLNGKKVAVTLSRYIDWKGYRFLIKAMSLLKDRYPDLVFLGVGSGDQLLELERLIAEHNLQEQFILTGWIEKRYIPSVLSAADIYVHAALREPFGFVFPEAMINEVPIVTTKTGAGRDALNHLESAYMVDYESPEQIAYGIEYMLQNDTREMTRKAKQQALNMYSIDKMFNAYVALYRKGSNL